MKPALVLLGVLIATWLLDHLKLVQVLWVRFALRTDKQEFWKSAPPELRLGAIAFLVAAVGVLFGFVGSLGQQGLTPLKIIGVVGAVLTLVGVLLGGYSTATGFLRTLGLRPRPSSNTEDQENLR
jgi:hypothetical protein